MALARAGVQAGQVRLQRCKRLEAVESFPYRGRTDGGLGPVQAAATGFVDLDDFIGMPLRQMR